MNRWRITLRRFDGCRLFVRLWKMSTMLCFFFFFETPGLLVPLVCAGITDSGKETYKINFQCCFFWHQKKATGNELWGTEINTCHWGLLTQARSPAAVKSLSVKKNDPVDLLFFFFFLSTERYRVMNQKWGTRKHPWVTQHSADVFMCLTSEIQIQSRDLMSTTDVNWNPSSNEPADLNVVVEPFILLSTALTGSVYSTLTSVNDN